jgi:hypothetical protein
VGLGLEREALRERPAGELLAVLGGVDHFHVGFLGHQQESRGAHEPRVTVAGSVFLFG